MKQSNADQALKDTLKRMIDTPGLKDKLFYVQFSDAERLEPPLSPSHPYWDDNMLPHMQWSRNARLFPCETGGVLPLVEIAQTWFVEMGWRGWVSMELFSRTMADPDPSVPKTHAERGIGSWHRFLKEIGQSN
jgi:4-hydroxyphenylpyruvate dioxygenase